MSENAYNLITAAVVFALIVGGVVAVAATWVVRRLSAVVEQGHSAVLSQVDQEKARVAYEAALERERRTNERESEFIQEIRYLVGEFREVIDVLGTMVTDDEGWEARSRPLTRRLDHIDERMTIRASALAATAA